MTRLSKTTSKTTGALVLALCLGATPALADRVSNSRTASLSPDDPDHGTAVQEIDEKNGQAAIPLLRKVVASDPEDGDAHRQRGQMEETIGFYQRKHLAP